MRANRPMDVIVIGAGMIGLTTAILLARSGHQVTVLDRDPTEPPAQVEAAWDSWSRRGVSQFRQPHLMLPRWTQEMRREIPDLLELLELAGAARINLLHLQSESVTRGWQAGDEQFDTVTARRPILEAALGLLAGQQPGVIIRRGERATGLALRDHRETPQVVGVRTSAGMIRSELVIDAAGRCTPVPGWVGLGMKASPAECRERRGFVYYSRHYQGGEPDLPASRGPVLTHHPSLSVLTLPCDSGTRCVVLITSCRDRALRCLRESAVWEAVVRGNPIAEPWIRTGTPITGVSPIAGIQDITRTYGRDGSPMITGLVAVGDSCAATNPSLGRGVAIGAIQAAALRDVIVGGGRPDPGQLARDYLAVTAERVTPWVEATLRFDLHRLAEIEADIAGHPYVTDDPTWPMTTALMRGAAVDPVLARVAARIGGLLEAPPQALAGSEVHRRLDTHRSGPRYNSTSPTRDDVLHTLKEVTMTASA